MNNNQPVCINCKHHSLIDSTHPTYRLISEFHVCNKGNPFRINVVTGEKEVMFCTTERSVYSSCGPEGRYYESKEEGSE